MTHPQKAAAILVDVANRLEKIGVTDLESIRLWAQHNTSVKAPLGLEMTVMIDVRTQSDADAIAVEFGLPPAFTRCASCGSIDHSTSRTYTRELVSSRATWPANVTDDATMYVVIKVSSDRDTALVGAHA